MRKHTTGAHQREQSFPKRWLPNFVIEATCPYIMHIKPQQNYDLVTFNYKLLDGLNVILGLCYFSLIIVLEITFEHHTTSNEII